MHALVLAAETQLETPDAMQPKLAFVGLLLLAALGVWIWWVFLSRKRLIEDIPTTASKAVALGLNELTGTAQCNDPATSPQAGIECVWWKNTFYRKDSDGGWEKHKERVGGPIAFALRDGAGSIPVRPRKAEVVAPKVYEGAHVGGTARDTGASLVSRYLERRAHDEQKVVEHAIAVGEDVYVLGTAQLPADSLDVYIGPDREGSAPFLLRVGTEDDAVFAQRVGSTIGFAVAVLAAAGAGVAWSDGQRLKAGLIDWTDVSLAVPAAFVTVVLAVMATASVAFVYNGLVRLRQRAQSAWSLIDVELRRRHDLIPNLEEIVAAHAAHERDVQRSVAELRAHLVADLPRAPSDEAVLAADAAIRVETAALDRLLALVEHYPVLTADASFSALRRELIDTEDRVALAREFYNNSVLALHDRAKVFPGRAVAWVFELDLEAGFLEQIGGAAAPAVAAGLGLSPRAGARHLPTT